MIDIFLKLSTDAIAIYTLKARGPKIKLVRAGKIYPNNYGTSL